VPFFLSRFFFFFQRIFHTILSSFVVFDFSLVASLNLFLPLSDKPAPRFFFLALKKRQVTFRPHLFPIESPTFRCLAPPFLFLNLSSMRPGSFIEGK